MGGYLAKILALAGLIAMFATPMAVAEEHGLGGLVGQPIQELVRVASARILASRWNHLTPVE